MPALYRRWVGAFTLGECLGFGLLPVAGGLLVTAGTRDLSVVDAALWRYAASIVGGFGEGVVVGAFQARVLCPVFPELSRARWILHTGVAAALAWALGMAAPTLDDVLDLPDRAVIGIWLAVWMPILASIGVAQARALRGIVTRPGRWVTANLLGWAVGLPWTFLLPMSLPDTAPTWAFATALTVGGVLMGLSAGAVTGRWVLRFAREREERQDPPAVT